MSISENIKSAVAERNIPHIRDYLWSAIMFDKNMTGSFKESLEYVLHNGIARIELFEKDDGEAFDEVCTKENYNTLAGRLRINFSEYKLDALRRMGCILSQPKQTTVRTSNEPRNRISTVREVPPSRGRGDAGRKPGINATTIAAIAATVILIAIGGGYLLYKIIK